MVGGASGSNASLQFAVCVSGYRTYVDIFRTAP